jgi:hypothetical protein
MEYECFVGIWLGFPVAYAILLSYHILLFLAELDASPFVEVHFLVQVLQVLEILERH